MRLLIFIFLIVSSFSATARWKPWEDSIQCDQFVRLRWVTNSTVVEQIDRSLDETNWETIGYVYSISLKTNLFIDCVPSTNHYFYRRTPRSDLPVIVHQPVSKCVLPGTTVNFTCLAKGARNYQWYGQGYDFSVFLIGQTKPTMTFSKRFPSYGYPYYCVVNGCVTSKVAQVSYYGNPKQLARPVLYDRSIVFNVTKAEGDFIKSSKFTTFFTIDDCYSIVGSTFLPVVGSAAYIPGLTGKDGSLQLNYSTWVSLCFKSRTTGTFILTDADKVGSQSGTFVIK